MGLLYKGEKDNMYLGYSENMLIVEMARVGVQKRLNDGRQKFDGSMEILGFWPKTAGRFFWAGGQHLK